jgi:guanylate kinase
LRKKNKGGIFVISAPSGAGKTTLCRKLIEKDDRLRPSVSFTTRSPREGEIDDRDYTFITEKVFRNMIGRGEFVEWAEVHGNLYGTSKKRLQTLIRSGLDVILDIDVQGARQIRNAFQDSVSVFILPPSLKALRERIEKRKSNTREDIERRLRRAASEIRDYKLYDYVIVNDVLREALKCLAAVITAERLGTRRIDAGWIKEHFLS